MVPSTNSARASPSRGRYATGSQRSKSPLRGAATKLTPQLLAPARSDLLSPTIRVSFGEAPASSMQRRMRSPLLQGKSAPLTLRNSSRTSHDPTISIAEKVSIIVAIAISTPLSWSLTTADLMSSNMRAPPGHHAEASARVPSRSKITSLYMSMPRRPVSPQTAGGQAVFEVWIRRVSETRAS